MRSSSREKPCHRAPDRRHVSRRPCAQIDHSRVRLPPASCIDNRPQIRGRSCGRRPPSRPRPANGRWSAPAAFCRAGHPPDGLIDGLHHPPDGARSTCGGECRACAAKGQRGADHHLTKRMAEDLTGSAYLGAACALRAHPFRRRNPGAHRDHPRSPAGRPRCADQHQTCCARASTFPNAPWWRYGRGQGGLSALPDLLIRPSAGRRAYRQPGVLCRCAGPVAGGGAGRTDRRREAGPTTPPTTSRRIGAQIHRRHPAGVYERDQVTVDTGVSGRVCTDHNLRATIADMEKKMRQAAAPISNSRQPGCDEIRRRRGPRSRRLGFRQPAAALNRRHCGPGHRRRIRRQECRPAQRRRAGWASQRGASQRGASRQRAALRRLREERQ